MVTQFLTALNDNIFKTAIYLLITSSFATQLDRSSWISSIATGAFVLPFILLSSPSGWLADRFSKVVVMRIAKAAEIIIAIVAAYLLYHQAIMPLVIALCLMGVHSTIFSPCKYGVLPELLRPRELSRGNGFMELWTLVAILSGQALAAPFKVLSSHWLGNPGIIPGLVMVLVSIVGFIASFYLDSLAPANPKAQLQLNPVRGVWNTMVEIRAHQALFLSLLAISFFSFAGQFVNLAVIRLSAEMFAGDDLFVGALLTSLTLGIGAGSVFAGRVSSGKVEMGLVPIGVLLIALGSFSIPLVAHYPYLVFIMLVLLGFGGGMFIVPLNAFFQHYTPPDRLGRFLATNNVLSFSGMLLASGVFALLSGQLNLSSGVSFVLVAILTLLVGVKVVRTLPEVLIRCINWIIANTFYRLRVLGDENIPSTGGALIICNHVSYADACLLLASVERPIRFLIYRPIYEHFLIRPFAKVMQAIPISGADKPKSLVASLREARAALERGEVVCIFAEGSITRIGQLLPFGKGFERIVSGLNVPIIPAYLDQVWGSIFSFRNGKFLWKWPKEIPYPVTLAFGKPLVSNSSAYEVRQTIQELGSLAVTFRKRKYRVLQDGFIRTAKRRLFAPCVIDSSGRLISYIGLLAAALILTKRFSRLRKPTPMVGVWLPPSGAAAMTNVGLMMAGCIPVNLNYTSSKESLQSAIEQCKISNVVTSERFCDKMPIDAATSVISLEQLAKEITLAERIIAFMTALLCPGGIIERWILKNPVLPTDIATVIFSSGSTGEPKGVMLTHENICSNIESLYDVFQLRTSDGVLGVLPFFHSFGYTATLWLPLIGGIRAVYHTNPIESEVIGKLVEKHQLTILMATPTFLLSYLRKCTPEQFSSLRFVVVGAEKLKKSLSESFFEKFQKLPLEGYGCTELSPVAILNVPDYVDDRVRHTGTKPGSVGHPIPGVSARIVDTETFELLPPGNEGLLLIYGPNVMAGYLGNLDRTKEVLRDGWYVTGDIAQMDADGFITITDRLSRFSKIGGEMIPHIKIEDEIHAILQTSEQICAVTAVSDERKGEKLIVLHTRDLNAAELTKTLSEKGLPNLWIPKRENFYRIDEMPMLGSGKIDLKGLKILAKEKVGSKAES